MSNMKHTPTPWSYQCIGLAGIGLFGPDNKALWHHERSDEESHANSEFIVLAVNSHEQMVAALRETLRKAVELFDDAPNEMTAQSVTLAEGVFKRARAALAAAEAA